MRLVTGHFRDDEPIDLDWRALADPESTLVIYMGLANLGRISSELLAAGLPADTPALAVQNGTTPEQRRVFGELRNLQQRVQEAGLGAPLLIIIGRTVALADELDWYLSDEEARHVAVDRSVRA